MQDVRIAYKRLIGVKKMLTKEKCNLAIECLKISALEGTHSNNRKYVLNNYEEIKQLINEHFELVEKATPKKPIEKPSFASGYKCPNCESNIVLHGSHEICPTPCCSWCGQALDWSKEDE